MLNTSYCQAYYDKVKAAAEAAGPQALEAFQRTMDYLDTYAGRENTECWLLKDWAPWSFEFVMYRHEPEHLDPSRWFNGGVIYEGPGLGGTGQQTANGGAPTFTVSLSSPPAGEHRWGVHT